MGDVLAFIFGVILFLTGLIAIVASKEGNIIHVPNYVEDAACENGTLQILAINPDGSTDWIDTCRKCSDFKKVEAQ